MLQNNFRSESPKWIVWHIWNKAECGKINFPDTGRLFVTLHYKKEIISPILILYPENSGPTEPINLTE